MLLGKPRVDAVGARVVDLVLLICVTGALIACCILRSRDFPMWLDEIYGFNLITDSSTARALAVLGDQGDSGGPLYYVLARAWAAIFSASEISLRLFTAAGFVTGTCLLWFTLRRYYERWPTALGIAVIVAASTVIKFEVSNVRFYGLLFAAIAHLCTVAAWLDAETERPRFGLLVWNAVAVGAVILSHPLGILYAFAVSVALLLAMVIDRRWRELPAVMGSYAAGLLFLLLWLRQYIRLSDISTPTSWVPVPKLSSLFSMLSASWAIRALILGVLLVWLFEQLRSRRVPSESVAETPRSFFPLTIALALCFIDALFWAISVTLSSIYLPRYMIGVSIGLMFAVAELLRRIVSPVSFTLAGRAVLAVVFIACVAEIAKPGWRRSRAYASGKFDEAIGHTDLPIVCSSLHSFMPRVRYASRPERYFFLMEDGFAKVDPFEFKMTVPLQKYYPERYPNIVDRAQFVAAHPRFVVVIHFNDPSERLRKEGYQLTPLPFEPMPEGERFVLAEKRI